MDLYGEFAWRGLIYDETEGVRELVARERVTAYAGFDPTAASLHVGHLLPILSLARMQRFGHSPIALVGGGTGLIGDPSFKGAERALLSLDQVEQNAAGMSRSSSWLPRMANTPVRRPQRRKQFGDGTDKRAITGCDVVAPEDNQIGLFGQGELHGPRDVVCRHGGAVMNIGQQRDPETIECGREARHGQRGAGDP